MEPEKGKFEEEKEGKEEEENGNPSDDDTVVCVGKLSFEMSFEMNINKAKDDGRYFDLTTSGESGEETIDAHPPPKKRQRIGL